MQKMTSLVALVLGFVVVSAVSGLAGEPVNVDHAGVGIKGHDPVAYFTDGKAEEGTPKFQSAYKGVTYQFASAEHKAAFDKDPAKYVPQFGGFCAYAVSKGSTAPIDPDAFQIIDGRLLLQYSTGVRDKFAQDAANNLKKADDNWPGIVAKQGK